MELDRLSPSELNEYHKHRKKLRYTYICEKCAHSFDREKPVNKCIFCSGPIRQMERDDIPTPKKVRRYMCPACGKTFIAEKADVCVKCGGRFLHFYETDKITTREVLSLRKRQLKEKIMNTKKKGMERLKK